MLHIHNRSTLAVPDQLMSTEVSFKEEISLRRRRPSVVTDTALGRSQSTSSILVYDGLEHSAERANRSEVTSALS